MQPALRHTDIPHTSKLFADFLYQYHRVERFYTAPPSTGYPEERRPALIAALRQQNTNEAALEKLALPGALAVVTGQQVGLFGGPAYTVYKALTAAKLAADLTARGRPAVPVFWLATEDHDWAEVDHAHVYNAAHQPVTLRVGADINGGGVPVGSVQPRDWPIPALRDAMAGLPFCGDAIEAAEASYAPGATMGSAFQRLLEHWLRPFGFLFLDPLQPAIRELAGPLMRRAFAMGTDLNRLLLQRNRELENAGYHAQVHVDARTSLFFLLDKGRRLPLRDIRVAPEDLAGRPQDLSPNALLRPVVQDFMLPTAAYVGGPAELAYFAQSQVLYEALLGHMPRLASRSGFTLLDARSAKLIDRYGLAISDFFHGQEPLRERIASALVPGGLQQQFDDARSSASEMLRRLARSVRSFDPTLEAAVEKSGAKMLYQLSKARAKVAREMLRRDERAGAEAAYLYGGLFPEKHLQERYYGMLPFLAQHGPDLLDRVYANVRLDCPDHVLLQV